MPKASANLAQAAREKDLMLVHISTDYVFDGTKNPHTEDEYPQPAERLRRQQSRRRYSGQSALQTLSAAHFIG